VAAPGHRPELHNDLERWIEAARGGSVEALGRLLEACRQYLLLVANRELAVDLQAKGGASDLVQETFLEAQRDFGLFQGHTEAELLAWLRQVLLHNLANFARQYRGTDKRQIDREVSLDQSDPQGGPPRDVAADTPSPSGWAVRNEQAEAVERALERLPEDYLQVILLRHREQRSFEEIGHLMNRSAEATRKLWSRAIEQLQRELTPPHEHS